MTGRDLDPDGFVVRLDDGPPMPLTPQSPVTFRNVVPGAHIVRLDGVAPNCEVESPNPLRRAFTFVDGPTVSERFDVFCMTHGTGRLRVVVTGFDDFGVSLDEGPVSKVHVFTEVVEGPHSVRLFLDPGACTPDDDPNPRSASVTAGRTAYVIFFVTCPLVVAVTTTGENRPSGYTAYIEDLTVWAPADSDWGQSVSVSATGTVALSVQPQIPYRVSLRGVPQNCAASPASHTLVVPAAGSGRIAFAVTCT